LAADAVTSSDVTNAPGSLDWQPATDHPELLAEPVCKALALLADVTEVMVAPIDPDLADTAAFCARYGVELDVSANCVIVAGRRGAQTTYAAAMLLATTRLDVNGSVRTRLGARKASFAPLDTAVELTAMEYGGITPIGVPGWPILIDSRVVDAGTVVIGSGLRRSKIALPGSLLAQLPFAEMVADLAG
jgi:prolyl-tRNA editing enzyme YbaK/EbsC (Cys-tRNA(Pro) deacylase)